MKGKSLLGEIPLSRSDCEKIGRGFRAVFTRLKLGGGLARVSQDWPLTLACWLANQSFFQFVGGRYWPDTLGPLGIEDVNAASSRFGQQFLDTLERFKLPRFRRMRTRWSYLGPILAHGGIPESCLGEFFQKVVPLTQEVNAWEDDGFEELLRTLPRLYLHRPTQMFLQYGDRVARDFLHRASDLLRIWRTTGEIPTDGTGPKLPRRVLDAFRSWTQTEDARSSPASQRRICKRPFLELHDWEGICLRLPEVTPPDGSRTIRWLIEADDRAPEEIHLRADPGEGVIAATQQALANPFGHLRVRLHVDDRDLLTWTISGVTAQQPCLFFDPDSNRIVPQHSVEARPMGVICPADWTLRCARPAGESDVHLIESRGRLPLGWKDFLAHVVDLSDCERLDLVDGEGKPVVTVDLLEVETRQPRLRADGGVVLLERRGCFVFVGGPPTLEIWNDHELDPQTFLSGWSVEMRVKDACRQERTVVSIADLPRESSEDGLWWRICLDHERLLGAVPWGAFEIRAVGPLGQAASFDVRVLPPLQVTHDWNEGWNGSDPIRVHIRVPTDVSLHGLLVDLGDGRYRMETRGECLRFEVECRGYGDRTWRIPHEVAIPLPAWSIYDPASKTTLLAWSRQPLRISVVELEQQSPMLLLRLATPWGTPRRALLKLKASATRDLLCETVALNPDGRGSIDLRPVTEAARQRNLASLRLEIELDLARPITLSCGEVFRQWTPRDFTATVSAGELSLRWSETIRVQERAVRIASSLSPWDSPVVHPVPDSANGSYRAPVHDLVAVAGLYEVSLGRVDPWTGRFEAAAGASTTVEVGTAAEWAARTEFSDPGPIGFLYRLLLDHHAGIGGNLEVPGVDAAVDQRELAGRLLRAREALATDGSAAAVRSKLDRLLFKLRVAAILAAIAAQSGELDRASLLRSGLLARPWSAGNATDDGVQIDFDALWRAWKPLGLWADLQLHPQRTAEVEARILRQLGGETVGELSPVGTGSQFIFHGAEQLRGTVAAIRAGVGVSPFEVLRVGGAVELVLDVETPAPLTGRRIVLYRDQLGGWRFADAGDEVLPLPEEFSGTVLGGPEFFYPNPVPRTTPPLEAPLIDLIRHQKVEVLRAIRHQASPLPTSPISSEAYQHASFEWCLRAASDPAYRDELEGMCRTAVANFSRFIERTDSSVRRSKAAWRAARELRGRWLRNAHVEPLFAVPAVSWLAAFGLYSRSFGLVLSVSLREAELIALCAQVDRLLPHLFEHDLLKMGTMIAFDLAATVTT